MAATDRNLLLELRIKATEPDRNLLSDIQTQSMQTEEHILVESVDFFCADSFRIKTRVTVSLLLKNSACEGEVNAS